MALDNGSFRLARPRRSVHDDRRSRRAAGASDGSGCVRSTWLTVRAAVGVCIVAVVVALLLRGNAFWCGARGIPLGTLLRRQGFSYGRMPNLAGQTALVTGANTGLGLEVSRQLARANASVVLACRDAARCDAAVRLVRAEAGGDAAITSLSLDLSDLHSVTDAAAELLRRRQPLDMLVLNAGVASQFPTALTVDGVERTFQVSSPSPVSDHHSEDRPLH